MYLHPQESEAGKPLKFKLQGFPDETAAANAIERFYQGQAQAQRSFEIFNMFDELIITGRVDEQGKIAELVSHERIEPKSLYKKDKDLDKRDQ